MNLPELSIGEFELVYNMLSLAIAAMFGSFVFFTVARNQLTHKYRPALIMSSLVVGIAGYPTGVYSTAGKAHMLSLRAHTSHQVSPSTTRTATSIGYSLYRFSSPSSSLSSRLLVKYVAQ